MDSMFNNPFTPESKKAKKSLFNKKTEKSFYVSKEIEKKIADPLVEYGPLKIAKSEIGFIKDLEQNIIEHNRERGFSQDNVGLREAKKVIIGILQKKRAETQLSEKLKKISSRQPGNIDEFGHITRLDCTDWLFATLPESISNLKNLRELNLSQVGLSSLPESLFHLKNLWDLDLSDNVFISSLSNEIVNLSELTHLNIAGTSMILLPDTLPRLKHLSVLKLNLKRFIKPNLDQIRQLKTALPKLNIINIP